MCPGTIAAPAPDRTTAFLALLAQTAPSLAERLRAATITALVRGGVAFPNHVHQAAGHGWPWWARPGYHRNPITGHDMTDAFRDAQLRGRQLGRAVRGEVPERDALAANDRDATTRSAPPSTSLASSPRSPRPTSLPPRTCSSSGSWTPRRPGSPPNTPRFRQISRRLTDGAPGLGMDRAAPRPRRGRSSSLDHHPGGR
jgi:hypothetical protein